MKIVSFLPCLPRNVGRLDKPACTSTRRQGIENGVMQGIMSISITCLTCGHAGRRGISEKGAFSARSVKFK